jgi:hypothetical protein
VQPQTFLPHRRRGMPRLYVKILDSPSSFLIAAPQNAKLMPKIKPLVES